MKCMQAAVLREIGGRVSKSSLAGLVLLALGSFAPLQAQEPIKIGFGVSLTGGLASSGKAHLLSKQIWLEEINARAGSSAVRCSSSTTTTRATRRMCRASTPSSSRSTKSISP